MTWNLKWRRKWEFWRKLNCLPGAEGTFSRSIDRTKFRDTNSSIFITKVSRRIIILDGAICILKHMLHLSRTYSVKLLWNLFLRKMSMMENESAVRIIVESRRQTLCLPVCLLGPVCIYRIETVSGTELGHSPWSCKIGQVKDGQQRQPSRFHLSNTSLAVFQAKPLEITFYSAPTKYVSLTKYFSVSSHAHRLLPRIKQLAYHSPPLLISYSHRHWYLPVGSTDIHGTSLGDINLSRWHTLPRSSIPYLLHGNRWVLIGSVYHWTLQQEHRPD